jgi:DNA-binding LacI/PurR family transcriptional regulator
MARPPVRQQRLFKEIQQRIQRGEFIPGSRIPARQALAKTYGVSPVTVQRVFDRLIEEGYVEPRGRSGSFVSETPPHLNHYWLIYPHEGDHGPSPFRVALTRETQKLARQGPDTFSIHVGHGGNFRHGDYLKLLHDVTTHRTAGLIFATAGNYWNETPLRKEPNLPRVAFSHGATGPDDIALIRFDREAFLDRSLDRLQSLGRRRVAVLACALSPGSHEHFQRGVAARGMETRPYWIQFVHAHGPAAARNLAQLLVNPEQRARPDALIILDDSLIESAVAGLSDAGVAVPDDLTVIAHANFPHSVASPVPLIHLGYDVAGLLAECLKLLGAQRRGEPYPQLTLAPPLFTEELTGAPAPAR